jgi:hypothetical protein
MCAAGVSRVVLCRPVRYTCGDTWRLAATTVNESRRFWREFRRGGMAEWSMAVVLKTTEPETVPGVRIPLPPPSFASLSLAADQIRSTVATH